jgi:hypothetical protein
VSRRAALIIAFTMVLAPPASAETIFDGSKRSFERWRHAGGAPPG